MSRYRGKRWKRPRWFDARNVLEAVLANEGGRIDGKVRYLAEGLFQVVFWAPCVIGGEKKDLVVRMPLGNGDDDPALSAEGEARLLSHLGNMQLPLRLPRVIAVLPLDEGYAMVQEAVPGIPLETRAPRSRTGDPWEAVADIAAVCHGIDTGGLSWLRSYGSRREHVLSRLERLRGHRELDDVREWVMEHLPERQSVSLLHGDLLGQNILVDFETGELGLIDWSLACIGDPAYDLAVVTRGARKPFQMRGGRKKLIEAYSERSVQEVAELEVQVHELLLLVGFYLDEDRGPAVVEQDLQRVMSFLGRLPG